ncbi:MAG: GAF domain-containing protein, partial [Synechocystis sp.]
MLDSAQLLFDLQRINRLAQGLSGCLDPQAIAKGVTEALISQFNCAFARLWLMEPSQDGLRLVASSGLYTHTDGSFARVPLGAYKVGKIAQNRVPFLSNCLADEAWVKDRQWAIANNILGFAGYPLLAGDRVLGVLATFSHYPMAPEFLEVLQVLCLTTTIALDAALQVQQSHSQPAKDNPAHTPFLSDQLASLLPATRLMLMGTERPLSPSLTYALIYTAEVLHRHHCRYCRLTYTAATVTLEALLGKQPTDLFPDSLSG